MPLTARHPHMPMSGQPMHPESLAGLLRKLGVPTGSARTAAIPRAEHFGERNFLGEAGLVSCDLQRYLAANLQR